MAIELKLAAKRHKLFNLVIVAEGNLSGNAEELAKAIKEKAPEFDTKVTVIGHLQRGGAPSCSDRVLASRLGYAAVEALIKNKRDVAIGIVNDHITYTPFEDAIKKTKDLNKDLIAMAHILAI